MRFAGSEDDHVLAACARARSVAVGLKPGRGFSWTSPTTG